jgi:hypothetical protein
MSHAEFSGESVPRTLINGCVGFSRWAANKGHGPRMYNRSCTNQSILLPRGLFFSAVPLARSTFQTPSASIKGLLTTTPPVGPLGALQFMQTASMARVGGAVRPLLRLGG